MQHRVLSFSWNVFFMSPLRHWLYSSCGFMCFSDTTESSLRFRCLGLVSRMHAWENALLHGIAAAFDVSNFRLAFFNDVFVLFITRISRINSFQFSGMFAFQFLDCPFLCFSSSSGFSNSCPSVTGHMWSGRDVVWIFVTLFPHHMYPFRGVSSNNVNLVKPVHESDRFLSPSTFP